MWATLPKGANMFGRALVLVAMLVCVNAQPELSDERVAFTTDFGEIELAFYPEIAPKTVKHILKLFQLGAYNTNHIFRVDAGFVAQISSISLGTTAPINEAIKKEEAKTVPLEVTPEVEHVTGVLSMARHSEKDSGRSSFSMLLGNAPHLDMEYTIFGKVTKGMDVLAEMQKVPTFQEGIFVKPIQRITIHSSYWYSSTGKCKLLIDPVNLL
ncbi:hypothetical protein BSKO_02366 [Bryopsis sp. KO-2023]|nr:hypothetical protein BSKO_02366 [Bryopsis sp. KO-2023]